MRVGGYTLDLYCDNEKPGPDDIHGYKEFPHQYYAEHGSQCLRAARADGWKFGKDKDLCPKCSGKGKQTKRNARAGGERIR